MEQQIKVGNIYTAPFHPGKLRIIGVDEQEVFYDAELPDSSGWMLQSQLHKTLHFYRIAPAVIVQQAEVVDTLPLTEEEFNVFRPDLCLRTARTATLSWNQFPDHSVEQIKAHLLHAESTAFFDQTLNTATVYLAPYGPKGSFKKAQRIEAANGAFFEVGELVWKAQQLQQAVNSTLSEGIGIYRLGALRGVPAYYIGEVKDRAGFL